jgi:lipopolysaccharide/colanic/teichoic acid biosynthesis glycosyltransferase
VRRAFDTFCAAAGLVLLSPFLGVIALVIKLEDGGPVFYRHPRMGRNFRKFGLLKFRSMVPRADKIGGPVTAAGDPRVTRVGRWLRKYKLDELPQLVNVLKGELALVGARPEVERYVDLFRSQYAEILRDPPGITDPATLAFRREEEMLRPSDVEEQYVAEILPRKLDLSLEYSRQRNLLSDLGILARTVLGICWSPRPSPVLQTARQPRSPVRVRSVTE